MQPLPALQHCYDRNNAEGELKPQVKGAGKSTIKRELLQQTKDDAAKKRAEEPMTMSEVVLPQINRVLSLSIGQDQSREHIYAGRL